MMKVVIPSGARRAKSRNLHFRGFRHLASALALVVIASTVAHAQSAPAPKPSDADVYFMSGMIPHHAQAVLIAGWAASHGARDDVRILCERIVVGQRDEIALMQYWLREHGAPVPEATATHMKMKMNGMDHEMLMPGMLNDDQLAALDKARGSDWDRLFLQAMIAHHAGAISMVNELLGSTNAAQDDMVYRLASDVYADQTTEIERMTKMLATVPPSTESRP
ncbi:MAG: DUF305 domain-containing protein [Gemmatimonadaceae bacterium]